MAGREAGWFRPSRESIVRTPHHRPRWRGSADGKAVTATSGRRPRSRRADEELLEDPEVAVVGGVGERLGERGAQQVCGGAPTVVADVSTGPADQLPRVGLARAEHGRDPWVGVLEAVAQEV